MDMLKKIPVREQDPKVRAANFEEVCYGYNEEEARGGPMSEMQERQMYGRVSCIH